VSLYAGQHRFLGEAENIYSYQLLPLVYGGFVPGRFVSGRFVPLS